MVESSSPQFVGQTAPILAPAKKEAPKQKKRGAHRAQYPTPAFYLFAFLLNLVSLLLGSLLYSQDFNEMVLLALTILGAIGVVISIYSLGVKPREANKRLRKILVAVTACYGFIIFAAVLTLIFLNPTAFSSLVGIS